MFAKEIPGGVAHTLPPDIEKALTSKSKAFVAWKDITPLAQNEWICWIITVKKIETRESPHQKTDRRPHQRQASALLLGRLYPSID